MEGTRRGLAQVSELFKQLDNLIFDLPFALPLKQQQLQQVASDPNELLQLSRRVYLVVLDLSCQIKLIVQLCELSLLHGHLVIHRDSQ